MVGPCVSHDSFHLLTYGWQVKLCDASLICDTPECFNDGSVIELYTNVLFTLFYFVVVGFIKHSIYRWCGVIELDKGISASIFKSLVMAEERIRAGHKVGLIPVRYLEGPLFRRPCP